MLKHLELNVPYVILFYERGVAMVYTVTLNPAVDYLMRLDNLKINKINRSVGETVTFGGKGINVSLILNELSIASIATGFTAGFTGVALEEGIACENIKSDFVRLGSGMTRINVKLRTGNETDINASGPNVTKDDIDRLMQKLSTVKSGDIVVLSGSVPPTMPKNIYQDIMVALKDKGVRFVVDAEGQVLIDTLKCKPFLIKPNKEEIEAIFGQSVATKEKALEYALKLKEMGAENVIVSLGKDGAVLADSLGKQHFMSAKSGTCLNTVGAGDSMVAGFIAGYLETNDFEYALKLGTAAGSATAASDGLAGRDKILQFM